MRAVGAARRTTFGQFKRFSTGEKPWRLRMLPPREWRDQNRLRFIYGPHEQA
jgi:hypothetical protein